MTIKEQKELNDRARVLTIRYKALMGMEQTPVVKDIIKEYTAEVDRLYEITAMKHEYLFNFIDGGWNSVWAYTIEEAKQIAVQEYDNSDKLKPDTKTFRVSTEADYSNLLSLFY
jgi:hypothetical protein